MFRPDWGKLAEAAPCRRICGGKVEIGAIVLAPEFQIFVNVIQDVVFGHGWIFVMKVFREEMVFGCKR